MASEMRVAGWTLQRMYSRSTASIVAVEQVSESGFADLRLRIFSDNSSVSDLYHGHTRTRPRRRNPFYRELKSRFATDYTLKNGSEIATSITLKRLFEAAPSHRELHWDSSLGIG